QPRTAAARHGRDDLARDHVRLPRSRAPSEAVLPWFAGIVLRASDATALRRRGLPRAVPHDRRGVRRHRNGGRGSRWRSGGASEVTVRVRHDLMSLGGEASAVSKVCAHPQALAQCTNWLNRNVPQLERVPVASNAEGARLAAEDATVAAIAGDLALELYGLEAIASGIQDDPLNRPRFLVIGRSRSRPSGRDQTSAILSAPDRAGAVHSLIEPLARHGVSMKRFESRPARQGNWEYYFHIDLIGHEQDAAVAAALGEIRAQAAFFKLLGSYPYEHTPA